MAKRPPSSQPRTRRTRTPDTETPAQAADTAIASTTETTNVTDAPDADDASDDFAAADTGPSPSEEDIRTRAYHRYLERGGGHGQDFNDWVEAERELKNGRRG